MKRKQKRVATPEKAFQVAIFKGDKIKKRYNIKTKKGEQMKKFKLLVGLVLGGLLLGGCATKDFSKMPPNPTANILASASSVKEAIKANMLKTSDMYLDIEEKNKLIIGFSKEVMEKNFNNSELKAINDLGLKVFFEFDFLETSSKTCTVVTKMLMESPNRKRAYVNLKRNPEMYDAFSRFDEIYSHWSKQ